MSSIPVGDPRDDPASDGDSDAGSEAHYWPISAEADSDTEDSGEYIHSNGGVHSCHDPTSPIPSFDRVVGGVSGLDLNGNGVHAGEQNQEEEDEEEEEEEMEMEASISRAFREDESRRSAPLTRENAARVMEAMRGVSFPGCPPGWAGEVAEERWIDQLRRLSAPSARPPRR